MYYFIGIKGTGMSALAVILKQLGNSVSGSDVDKHFFTESELIKNNIPFYVYDADNIKDGVTVIKGASIKDDNVELVRARELELKILEYNEMVGLLTEDFKTICVAGCHGKTTTTNMLALALRNVGVNYLIGDGTGSAFSDNPYFALEACEYKRHFLAYHPYYAIVTNIELEHTECYKDINEIIETFSSFANKASVVVACGDDSNVRRMKVNNKVTYYGFNDDNDVVAKNIKLSKDGSSFDVYIDGNFYNHFDIPLFGDHMILDALACITICNMEGVKKEDVATLLLTFKNAKRRFKETTFGDVVVIDDYAHHPTEIRVTIESARKKYSDKKIVAVFLPNTYSRTKALMKDFISALKEADKAYVMDIHCDRERQEDYEGVSSDEIINNVPNAEKISIDSVQKLLEYKNAAICFMSCTNIYEIEDKFKELLENKNN